MYNTQKYEVTIKFTFEGEVFDSDPDDVFELAELEEPDIEQKILNQFAECDIEELIVKPVVDMD